MTEDEAKTKACCNGAQRPKENGPCIGSGCMAWRWGVKGRGGWIEFVPRPEMTEEQKADPANGLGGYCGLAGKP
jgi:hypothetical protein